MKTIQWNMLREFSLPCTPGNEALAAEQMTTIVQALNLSTAPLLRLRAAVTAAHAAMQCDNPDLPKLSVCIRVLGAGLDTEEMAQGWGFFLIEKMAEGMVNDGDKQAYHLIEVYLYL
jgi:hypothetical protein